MGPHEHTPETQHGGALLDRDLEIVAHPHAQVSELPPGDSLQPVPEIAEESERTPDLALVVGERPDGHETFERDRGKGHDAERGGFDIGGRESVLRCLARCVYLEENARRERAVSAKPVQRLGKPQTVDGVYHLETPDRFRRLVALEVADEVPAARPRDRGALLEELLDAALSDVGDAGVDERLDDFGAEGLGHADDRDLLGPPVRGAASARDSLPDLFEIRFDRFPHGLIPPAFIVSRGRRRCDRLPLARFEGAHGRADFDCIRRL